MHFLALVLKNLTRRPLRTGLTLLALTTAVASVVSLRGIAKGLTSSFAGVYESHRVDAVVSRQGSTDRLSSSVGQASIAKIRRTDGVEKAAGVLLETLSLEDQQIFGIPTMGIAAGSWIRDDYRWVKRQEISADTNQVSLGVHLAARVDASVGDNVMLFEDPYRIAGIFESGSAWENGSMIMPLDQLQTIADRKGQVTYVNVVLDEDLDKTQATTVLDAIKSIDKRLHAMTTDEFVGSDSRMQIASAMAWMTSMIALVIGAIGTLNTMMTSVLERTREIGVLRAIGWPQKRVVFMVMSESLVLAVLASIGGAVIASLATSAMAQHPAAKGVLTPVIDSVGIAEGTALAVLIGLLGAIIPARRAARVLPTEALRA